MDNEINAMREMSLERLLAEMGINRDAAAMEWKSGDMQGYHSAKARHEAIRCYILDNFRHRDGESLAEIRAGRERGEEGAGGLTPADFTSQMVFVNMLRLWKPEQCREFYAMLSRRPDFNPDAPKEDISASSSPQRAFGQIREAVAGLPLWATGQFTQEAVFYNMLMAWPPDQCKKFYAMLSRRPDFNPEAGIPGEGYRLLAVGEIVEAGDEVWAYGNGPWGLVNDWTVGKAVIRGYNPMRRALLGEAPPESSEAEPLTQEDLAPLFKTYDASRGTPGATVQPQADARPAEPGPCAECGHTWRDHGQGYSPCIVAGSACHCGRYKDPQPPHKGGDQ